MSRRFLTPIESTVITGTAPLTIASTTAVTNLNADLLDGQHGSYYAPSASPTFTGTVTIPTLSLTQADTATAASHYMVEVASDGLVRPKTLANVQSEIVTTSTVNSASATVLGTIATGTWQGSLINPTYGGTGVNNGSNTITLGGNFATSGAFATTLTVTGATNVTLPTTGTLASTNVATLTNLTSIASGATTITVQIGYGATSSGNTKTINIGSNSASGSTTNINLGSAVSGALGTLTINSPTVTINGTATAPTAAVDTNTTQIATTAFVIGQGYAKLASPTLTGTPLAPTAASGTSTTQIATTAFVQTAVSSVVTNLQTSSASLVLSDAGKVVEMNVATANTITVPANSTVAFPLGTSIDIIQYGAGQTTITPAAGVTLRSSGNKLKLTSQYSGATLYKRGTDEWIVVGDLSA